MMIPTPVPLLLAGKQQPAADGRTAPVLNPATGAVLAETAIAGAKDVDRAAAAAQRLQESRAWRGLTPAERTKLMWRLAELLEREADALARLDTLNEGMPIGQSGFLAHHVAPEVLRYQAGWATRLAGESLPLSLPDHRPAGAMGSPYHAYTVREPVGIVGAIVPWNVPLLMAVGKIAPALAAGCPVILKPAAETPLSAHRLGELILEAGWPDAAVQILPGGRETGQAMVEHPGISLINFTGSTAAGQDIAARAAKSMKRLLLELGGKAPTLIFADAPMDAAIGAIVEAAAFNSGQICFAGTRIYVEESAYADVAARAAAAFKGLKTGDGFDPGTAIGPLISASQRERVTGFITRAVKEGATVLAGGKDLPGPGFFVDPTLLEAPRQNMEIQQEEVFGPVVTIAPFRDAAHALQLANDTRYGLSATIFSGNVTRAQAMAAEIKAGIVGINAYGALDDTVPSGGYRLSGFGREGGRAGVDAHTELKSIVVAL